MLKLTARHLSQPKTDPGTVQTSPRQNPVAIQKPGGFETPPAYHCGASTALKGASKWHKQFAHFNFPTKTF